MKKRALLVVLLCVMGLTALSIGNAEAYTGWFQVTINQVGPGPGYYYLALTDAATTPSFTLANFYLDQSAGMQNQLLATALTAVANGGNAWIYVTGNTVFSLFTR